MTTQQICDVNLCNACGEASVVSQSTLVRYIIIGLESDSYQHRSKQSIVQKIFNKPTENIRRIWQEY